MRRNYLGITVITIFVLFVIFAIATSEAKAQTFIGGGLKVAHSTNTTDSTFPGAYVEGGLKLPVNFQARFLGEYSREAELSTIFTRDNNPVSESTWELRLKPTLRYQLPSIFFVESGVDLYRQGFKGEGSNGYRHSRTGLNPLLGGGIRIKGYEGSYSRIFPDVGSWNISRLEGHRAGLSYYRNLKGRFGLKLSGEYDYVSFREEHEKHPDYYREYDSVARVRIGFTFGGTE